MGVMLTGSAYLTNISTESTYLVDRAHVANSLPGTCTEKLRGALILTQPARNTTFCRAKAGNAAVQLITRAQYRSCCTRSGQATTWL